MSLEGVMTISLSTRSSWLTSCLFAPVTTIDNGTPRPSTRMCRLLPFFSPICWVGTDCLTGERSLDHSAVYALPAPSDALHFVIFGKPRAPEKDKKTTPHPAHEMSVNRTWTSKPFLGKSLPLATGSQNIHDGFKYLTGLYRLPAASWLAPVILFRIAFGNRY